MVTTLTTALFVKDAGHGGGGDSAKIMSAGMILDTMAAFGRPRGCRKYAAVKLQSINQSIRFKFEFHSYFQCIFFLFVYEYHFFLYL